MNKTISLYTPQSNFIRGSGYPEACHGMVTTLNKLGYKVPFDSSAASIQLNFCQPSYYADYLRSNQYQIGYTAWESTEPMDDWPDIMKETDEVWTTSHWCKKIFESWNLGKDIKVYTHGIGNDWIPKRKRPGKILKFLLLGEPAPRKGGQIAYDAFKAAFENREDVCLYIKTKEHSTIRNRRGQSIVSKDLGKNVKLMPLDLPQDRLVMLYQQCDVIVCPSYGEGLGFFGLQGLATGTPTICTKEWAEYKNYLDPLGVESTYIDSPWQEMHPGQVCQPDFDDLVAKYRYCANNIEELHNKFYQQAFDVHSEYDWLKLTKKAFANVL